MQPLLVKLVVCLFLLMSSPGAGYSENWPRFRGPNGSGISDADIPAQWDRSDENWRVILPGLGHSSPIVWGDRVFVTTGNEKTGSRSVHCFDAETGVQVWKHEIAGAKYRKHQLNSFASSTPAADDRSVYVCHVGSDKLHVTAITHDGKREWQTELGVWKSGHGYGVSPIVHKNSVVIANEHSGQSLLYSLDSRNGKVNWSVPRATKATYSTPCVYHRKNGSAELIFTNWSQGITALDPENGKTNWQIDVFDKGHVETSIGSPFVCDNLVYGTSGWLGVASQTIAVNPETAGQSRVTQAFRVEKDAPLTTTPIANKGLLFLWADNGIVTCVDTKTGGVVWRKRVGGKYFGSPVIAKDRIYCLSTAGEVVVLAASPEYELLGRNQLGEASHSTPAVANGRMYLRTFSKLISISH